MDEGSDAQIEIRNLLAACTQAGDARKADAYARSFAADGILDLGLGLRGREAIRAWMNAPSVIPQPGGGVPGYVSHHLTTCHIELTSTDSAKARTYWFVITAIGVDHSGYYDDKFVRLEERWMLISAES